MDPFSTFFTTLKNSTPIVIYAFGLTCLFILIVPEEIITTLGLTELKTVHIEKLGFFSLFSIALLTINLRTPIRKTFSYAIDWYTNKQNRKKLKQARLDSLINLTPNEKSYLIPYIINEETTLYFLTEDGVAGELVFKNILTYGSSSGNILRGVAHNLQPWARKLLTENSSYLDGYNPNCRKLNQLDR